MKEIIRHFPSAKGVPMHIQMSGISFCDGSYHIIRPSSKITVIEYVIKGEGYVTVDGKDIAVTQDKVYILKRGTDQNYYSSESDPWEKIFINLQGSLPVYMLEQLGIADKWLFDGDAVKDLFLKIKQKVLENKFHEFSENEFAALYFEIISRLSAENRRAEHSDEAVKLKDHLDDNTKRIVSNNELANVIYRSPDYCVKLFGREYGTTPYNYQLNSKIDIAKRLLRDTSLNISLIASECGYHDPRYFSGLFKKKTGYSPKEYRKKEKT